MKAGKLPYDVPAKDCLTVAEPFGTGGAAGEGASENAKAGIFQVIENQ